MHKKDPETISPEIISRIKSILKFYPRGMSITDISKKLNMNRNSVARYLNLLVITGHIEMKTYGASKVFYPSERIPISSLLSFSTDFIVVLDRDGRIVQMNDPFLEFSGVERENIIGRELSDANLPIVNEPDMPDLLEECHKKGRVSREVSMQRDDKELFFRIILIPTVFDNGDQGITVIVVDITATKRADHERALLASIVENSDDAILGKRLDGTIFSWNAAAERMYCYTAEEAIGQNVSMLVPQDLQLELDRITARIIQGIGFTNYETQRLQKDGSRIDVSLTTSPIKNERGEVIGASTIARDITSWKRSQQELIIKDTAIASSINAIGIISLTGDIIYVNHAFLRMLGYSDESMVLRKRIDEILGKQIDTFIDKFSRGLSEVFDTTSPIQSEVRERGCWTDETRGRRLDGTSFDVRIYASLVKDPTGMPLCMMLILVDITDQKEAEKKLRLANQTLEDIIEFLPDPTFIIDQESRVIAWNRAIEKMTGIKKIEILSKSDYAYALPFYGKSRPILIDLIDVPESELRGLYPALRREGSSLVGEAFVPALYGGKGAFLWGKASPLVTREGSRIGAIESIRDISEWRKAEEAAEQVHAEVTSHLRDELKQAIDEREVLKEEIKSIKRTADRMEMLSRAMESAGDSILILDLSGRIRSANDAAVNLLDAGEEKALIGLPLIQFVALEHKKTVMNSFSRALKSGVAKIQFPFFTSNGRTAVDGCVSLIESDNGDPMGFLLNSRVLSNKAPQQQ